MTENPMIYAAVYANVDAALADLDVFERLRSRERTGKYDAVVIDKRDGEPRIVKRADHATARAIPQLLRSGLLTTHPLHDAAERLVGDEAAFVVAGSPRIEKAFDRAAIRARMTAKRAIDMVASQVVFGEQRRSRRAITHYA
jgi:hypothetical protein